MEESKKGKRAPKQARPRLAVLRHAYTLDDVADALELGRTAVDRLRDKGVLETYTVGRSIRVSQRQLDECVERLEAGAGADLEDAA